MLEMMRFDSRMMRLPLLVVGVVELYVGLGLLLDYDSPRALFDNEVVVHGLFALVTTAWLISRSRQPDAPTPR